MKSQNESILTIEHLNISFTQYEKGFRQTELSVIRDMSLNIKKGEMTAVIGASGSGKSLLAHAILGILPYNASVAGEIRYCGQLLTDQTVKKLRGREIVLVPQSVSYLDPLMKVGTQIRKGDKSPEARERSRSILKRYGMDESTQRLYPFQLSGGMTRRVMISTAVMENPGLVIADEPTPGLHRDAAKWVLTHFREIADEGAAVLLITHDLELALEVADRIVVLYSGTCIEEGRPEDFRNMGTLRHPYTRALFRAMPQNHFIPTPGTQPYVKSLPSGCPFAPRCPYGDEACDRPVEYRKLQGGMVRCVKSPEFV